MSRLHAVTHAWRLSTKVVVALAIAMLPMGVLAVLLAVTASDAAAPASARGLAIALPIMMWLAALFTGWFAVHRLIVEPLARIQRLIADYGADLDPATTRLRLGDADHDSAEIATLAESFDVMADAVDAHSRELHEAMAEQQRLTREVHHRVKNNLQIVASLLSLQARAADSPEAVQIYAVIQARIEALTQVHRWMYDDAEGNGVDLQPLITELCAGLETSLLSPDHRHVSVSGRLGPIAVHPDIAVPVAFLVTELASLAAQTGAPGPLAVVITVTAIDGTALLAVVSAAFLAADAIDAASMKPTARIIHGMARQLRSHLVYDPVAGSYSVRFAAVSA